MSHAAVDVAVRLGLQDSATPGIDKAAARVQQAMDKTTAVAQSHHTRQRADHERTSQARDQLVTRSEQHAQAALGQTQDAYDQLASHGVASAQTQGRAIDGTRAKAAQLTNELGRLGAAQRKVGEAAGRAVGPTTTPTKAENTRTRQDLARETLGVRSEQRIQEEIKNTQRAYAQLAAHGFASAQDQARALDATRAKVTALTNEMGRLTTAQRKAGEEAARTAKAEGVQARGAKALQTGGAVVAGAAAGAYALREPVMQAMNFDERLAHMSNTAFRERDVTGRKLGMNELRVAIDTAQQSGGGTRDAAAQALDAMIASGALSPREAITMLPAVTKAASAANADPMQLANIGIRAMQTFKIEAADMPNVLNMALAAGQAGGFELKDMSKWLPQQMAAATMSGMSGKAGFAKLTALNQAAAITAGTKDEAGNNVVNLLAKINSQDTAKDAQKIGVNLPKYLQEQRAKGVDSVDAFGALVQTTVGKRDDYQALQKKLKLVKNDDERRETLEGMATIAQGAGIGKLIQDRQAMMALLGLMNNNAYMATVLKEVRSNDVRDGGAVDQNFALISGTGAFKDRQRKEAVTAGEQRALDGVSMGGLNDAITKLAVKFPELTGSAALAATALGAAAAGAGLFAMSTGAGGGGAVAKAAGRAMEFLPSGKTVARAGIAGAAALGGGAALNAVAGEESAVARYGNSALTGASMGAMLGSFVPVIGTAVGAALGGTLGLGVEGFKDLFIKPPAAEAPKMSGEIKVSVSDDRVRVASTRVDATGMNASLQADTGNLWQGAM